MRIDTRAEHEAMRAVVRAAADNATRGGFVTAPSLDAFNAKSGADWESDIAKATAWRWWARRTAWAMIASFSMTVVTCICMLTVGLSRAVPAWWFVATIGAYVIWVALELAPVVLMGGRNLVRRRLSSEAYAFVGDAVKRFRIVDGQVVEETFSARLFAAGRSTFESREGGTFVRLVVADTTVSMDFLPASANLTAALIPFAARDITDLKWVRMLYRAA